MKFFISAYVSLNEQNAGATHILELANNIQKQNHSVILFVSKSKSTPFQRIVNVPILKAPVIKPLIFQKILLIRMLLEYSRIKPDILYTRKSQFMLAPLIISKILNVPNIIEVNGLFIEEIKLYNKYPKIYMYIVQLIEQLNYRLSNKIVVVTPYLKNELIRLFNIQSEKIIVIENGANIDIFRPITQNKAILESGLSNNHKYICFIGNLAPWQGVEYLVQAAPLILASCPNVRFLIVGDGPMKKEWIQLAHNLAISDKFIFTGSVRYEQVPMYINASDVCIVPKRLLKSGYSPLKLYEYMACGKPVIATRTDGFEILEKSNAGVLINPENSREFADAVIRLLQNVDLRKQMGANGRKYVVENHSWASVAKKVAEVCKNVIAKQSKKKLN